MASFVDDKDSFFERKVCMQERRGKLFFKIRGEESLPRNPADLTGECYCADSFGNADG